MIGEKSLFIKVENYNDTVDVIELIKNKIKENRGVLQKIRQMKIEEDALIERWNKYLDEMEGKFSYISESFSEGNSE